MAATPPENRTPNLSRNVSKADAPDHKLGYTGANDVSAHDWQIVSIDIEQTGAITNPVVAEG